MIETFQNKPIPRAQSQLSNAAGIPTLEWYNFFLYLLRTAEGNPELEAQIQAILIRLEALEDAASVDFQLLGLDSIIVVGTPQDGFVQINLEGDVGEPGTSWYYGSNADGVKGWYPVSDTISQVTGETTKSVDPATGITSIGLADVPDDGTGILQKTSFDSKGRKKGTAAATTDDLPEGSTNLYYTDVRSLQTLKDAVLAGESLTGDPFWNSVASLLHFDGTNGSTSIVDEATATWAAVGNAKLSTAKQKFGPSSLLLDGSGDYISSPFIAGRFSPVTDFTIEGWVNLSAVKRHAFFNQNTAATTSGFYVSILATGQIRTVLGGSTGFLTFDTPASGFPLVPQSTWTHVAVTKSGSTIRQFINGTLCLTSSATGTRAQSNVDALIGRDTIDLSRDFNGYIDEFRFTQGVARYVATFTPQTAEFPNFTSSDGDIDFEVYPEEGIVSIGLAKVVNSGVGTLEAITVDNKGRVIGHRPATASDVPIAKLGSATWDNAQEALNVLNSPGLIDGGGFTDAGSGNLAYSSMRVAIRPTDSDVAVLYMADVAGGSVAIPNDSATRFVGVQYNAGSPNVVIKTTDIWDYDTEFPLGEVANLAGTLFPLFNPYKVGDPITNIIQRFDAQAYAIRSAAGGLELSTDGTTRNLAMTAGVVWTRLNDHSIAARNSPTFPLIRVTPTGGTPPLAFTPGITAWPNTQYLSGITLTTLGNNRWAVLWVFVNIGSGAWGFAHGTAEYLNSSSAAGEAVPAYLTSNFIRQNILVGRLIFEKNATTAIIESAFTRVFSTQAVSNHNQLSGLQGGALNDYQHLTATQLAQVNSSVQSVSAGTGVIVDNTDPRNPIVSATAGAAFVPYNIPDGQSFFVPIDQQALFTMTINLGVGSSIVLDGALVEVS